jgi:hypothetical protein
MWRKPGEIHMSIQQVYVLWTHPLFHDAIRLLLEHPHIQFVGASSDFTTAQGEILSLRPDTILIEGVGESEPNQVMKVLKSCPWNVLVVLISLTDNQLNLYHHEQRAVGRTDELLQLILR